MSQISIGQSIGRQTGFAGGTGDSEQPVTAKRRDGLTQRLREIRVAYLPLFLTGIPLILTDVLAGGVALALVSQAATLLGISTLNSLFLPILASTIFGFLAMRAYRVGVSPIAEFLQIAQAARLVFFISAIVVAVQVGLAPAALLLVFGMPLLVGTITLARAVFRRLFAGWSWWGVPVCSVESNATSSAIQQLREHPERGLKPFVMDSAGADEVILPSDSPYGARLIGDRTALSSLGHPAVLAYRSVYLFGDTDQIPPLKSSVTELGGECCVELRPEVLNPVSRMLKRAFDLAITCTLLMVGSPLFLLLAVLVKLSSPGPVFYGQERIGRHGRHFKAWKFRSMIPNADAVLQQYLDSNPALRAEWDRDHKLRNDPRVTSIGGFLRKTSLDELPQLFNVLVGEMSLVGPRPIVDDEVEKYGAVHLLYEQIRPGITGLWQVSGRNNTAYEVRIGHDRTYVLNWSLLLDLYILVRTVKTVLLREGAY